MRFVEALIDYSIAVKEETLYGLGFLSTMIVLSALPFIMVMLLGAVFYIGFIAIGYFVALALVSPSTAEKLIKDAVESYRDMQKEEIQDNQIESEE